MKLIYPIHEFPESPEIHPERWTVIVPAAGRGSRLHGTGPKILYPILGKPILDWLVALIKPLCGEMILVASPDGQAPISAALKPLWPEARIVIQNTPTGMGDAIALCQDSVRTPWTLVIWGDQITPRPRTLAACMSTLESSSSIQAVIPTMERAAPYIHFRRGEKDRILEVFQARETEDRIARGESDCGVFCLRTPALFGILRKTRGQAAHQGARTGENNFLSLLPLFHNEQGSLVSVRLDDISETLGINTTQDAEQVSEILKKRGS